MDQFVTLSMLCSVFVCAAGQINLSPLEANERPVLPRHRGDLPPVGQPPESGVNIPGRPTLQRHRLGWPHDNKPAKGQALGHGQIDPPAPPHCLKHPFYEPCTRKDDASAAAERCCIEFKSLPSGCSKLCNLDVTLDDISIAVTGSECPFDSIKDVLSCLGNQQDVRDCCGTLGVGHSAHSEPCMQMCAGDEDPQLFPRFELELIKCLEVFDTVKKCLHAGHPDPLAEEKGNSPDKLDRLAELLQGANQAGRGFGGPDLEY